jgi:ornithine cyclodeaminase/alanine dehydrogenase-like protein (mu-crystallin family)
MPLYLTEADIERLFEPSDAVPIVEESFLRLAAGEVVNQPRLRLPFDGRALALMGATDRGLGVSGIKTYVSDFTVVLFDAAGKCIGVIEANRLGQLRTGAASAVAARHLAPAGARRLGIIGCGFQAETQVQCIRAAVPSLEEVVAFCRTESALDAFCARVGAEAAESHREAADADIVVTATSSHDPVLRGDWLRPGTLVCAVGANLPTSRELDDAVLDRATFVCCDALDGAKQESGDLIEPVEHGVLDWLEVHELHEVVAGDVRGRQSDDDVVVFKSNGIAAWDVAIGTAALDRARERGVGTEV